MRGLLTSSGNGVTSMSSVHHTPALEGPATHPTLELSMRLPLSPRSLVVVVALATTACATGRGKSALPDDITVLTLRRQNANTHVVSKGVGYFLVDAGYETDGPVLVEDLHRAGFDPAAAKAIIVTRGHPDRAGGASYFRKTFGTPVIAAAADSARFATGASGPLCPTSDRARKQQAHLEAARFTPFVPDVTVTSDMALEPLTGIPGRIVPVSGQAGGSLAVVLPTARAAIVGDMFRGAIVGRSADVHFYVCDLADNRRDVRELVDRVVPNARTFFTGYFGPVSREAVLKRFADTAP